MGYIGAGRRAQSAGFASHSWSKDSEGWAQSMARDIKSVLIDFLYLSDLIKIKISLSIYLT
jgi:hypothetical protein